MFLFWVGTGRRRITTHLELLLLLNDPEEV